MTFFLDNDISPKIARALHELVEYDVRHLKDVFDGPNVPDCEWIASVAGWGWVAITADLAMRTRPAERQALQRSGLMTFFVCEQVSRRIFWPQAVWFVKHWPNIKDAAESAKPGTCFLVSEGGTVRRIPLT